MPSIDDALARLGPALREGGNGVRVMIHSETPSQCAALLARRFPELQIGCVDTYADLGSVALSLRPQLCLSYRFGPDYPREALFAADPLYVHVAGTGFDHLLPWDPEHVVVCNSAGYQAALMADFVLGALLALNMRFPAFMNNQRSVVWAPLNLTGIDGQWATVLGTGPIGSAIAARLRSVGLRVTGVSRSGAASPSFDTVIPVARLAEVLPETDHLVLAIPRTHQTLGLMSRKALALLKTGATVVNVARGGIVDEAAIHEMLKSGQLAGALLDVFATEPLPADSPLWSAPNLMVTPHTASLFDGWEVAAAEIFCDNLDRLARGEPMLNRIDPTKGY